MKLSSRTKVNLLLIGDICSLYIALIVTLLIRYGRNFYVLLIESHLAPFSAVFAIWLVIFYIAGLYDLRRLRNNLDFIKNLLLTLSVNAAVTIAIFYLVPFFGIAPKTNLFIFMIIFAAMEIWWRRTFNIRASFREGLNRVLLFGEGPRTHEIVEELKRNPQVGYEIKTWLKGGIAELGTENLRSLAKAVDANLVVVPPMIKNDPKVARGFYDLLTSGIEVLDLPAFYEVVFRKIPLSDIEERWFIENRIGQKKFYDDLKRGLEFAIAAVLSVILIPIFAAIAVLVRFTSSDRILCRQTRVGHNGARYVHYKFRTMRSCNEKNGPQWKVTEGARLVDPRLTAIGKILASSHLDELPQLYNILRGDMSFVGPRPERPEFVDLLEEKVSYYQIRHLVRPGVTGWAQINYPYGGSIEGTQEKLQYDIYYLKNRSLILDCAILIKTIKTLFVNPK